MGDEVCEPVSFFAPNTSTLVEFTVQRVPSERVFKVGTEPPAG